MTSRRGEPSGKPYYLVSAAGVPNFGDELLTRAWLDWLAATQPRTEVWLDCLEPGRAAHLFADAHPRLRFTNTLWQLAQQGSEEPDDNEALMRRFARDFGSPRVDFGIEQLHEVQSIHFMGGGYLNSLWRRNLSMLAAAVEVKKTAGVKLFATGQGLTPQTERTAPWVAEMLAQFDLVESRDRRGADLLNVPFGLDDAFLAFANERPVFAADDAPELMLLLQGDFGGDAAQLGRLIGDIRVFASDRGLTGRVGLVEGMPPDDAAVLADVRDGFEDVRFYTFADIWRNGVPARRGQTWVTTRFHFHLLAAAAGAKGTAVTVHPDYYGVKHSSLLELGTGWQTISRDREVIAPSADPSFAARIEGFTARKVSLARELYPKVKVTGIRSALRRVGG